ncbi:hypothetical protein M0R45_018577 [Rubus argutus]|uniref:Uncharacterized protein n=1 Tax=Rubus argutus TaxID=59490 RepID=A0AAW1X351_RUBAR
MYPNHTQLHAKEEEVPNIDPRNRADNPFIAVEPQPTVPEHRGGPQIAPRSSSLTRVLLILLRHGNNSNRIVQHSSLAHHLPEVPVVLVTEIGDPDELVGPLRVLLPLYNLRELVLFLRDWNNRSRLRVQNDAVLVAVAILTPFGESSVKKLRNAVELGEDIFLVGGNDRGLGWRGVALVKERG